MEKTQQWDKVKELFGAALQLEPAQRSAFLAAACDQDDSLLAEINSLLAAHDDPDSLSESPWQEQLAAQMRVPIAVGPYHLVRKLGEGGMGEVWLAQQTTPVKRQVALKLIRAGMLSASLLERFEWERQSLAMMDHPAIARVFEAGSTPDGQPYLVMEYVPGLPITEYCDEKKLSIRERLQLFIRACEGVQHAHQKAIIHRDIKPANILVVEVDGQPMPRIIDFGLAKALPGFDQTVMHTQAGNFLGTPGYMSPEQAAPGTEDVDTRTDVYSLGVVLYVLLTGFLPFDSRKKPVDEILRQLREDDPPRPSSRISVEKETSSAHAVLRGTEFGPWRAMLNGDLDWIAMRAVEKDRNRRYGTPSELVLDVRRYLNNEPVSARPASTGYRLKKYARRHRAGVAFAAVMLIVFTSFTALQARQLRRVTRERDRADRITGFMTGMFKMVDPSEAHGNSITVREVLDKASKNIDTGLANDPEVQAQMMFLMGSVYWDLGLFRQGELLLRRSMEIRRRVLGPEKAQTMYSMIQLSAVLISEGHYEEAEKLVRQTLDIRVRKLGPEHPDTLQSRRNLEAILLTEGHYTEAEVSERETLKIQRRTLGPEHRDTLLSMFNLGRILQDGRHYAEAEKVQRETIEIQSRVLGHDHLDTLRSMVALGATLRMQGRSTEAEELQRATIEIQNRVLGSEHPDTLVNKMNLGLTLSDKGHYAEAEQLQREIIAIQRRVLGPEHPDTLRTMLNLGYILSAEKHYPEAEKLLRQTMETRRRVLGPDHPNTLNAMANLAFTLINDRQYDEAEKLGRETLEAQRRVFGPEHPDTALSVYNLACIAARKGKRDDALGLLRNSLEHGLSPAQSLAMSQDSDLASLHGDPRFEALVALAKSRAVKKSN